MTRYANATSVPMERSRQEAERVLVRYGASGFAYSWERRREPNPARRGAWDPEFIEREVVLVAFKMPVGKGKERVERHVRLQVPMPHEVETGTKTRTEQAVRQRWRALVLVLKAKLEAVASGISSLESEFMAGIVTENGRTIGELLLPRLTEAVKSGRLLPAAGER